MKNLIKSILQSTLGYQRYLRWFSLYKVRTLGRDKNEDDFRFFLTMLPDDGVVLDIGANLGFLAIWISRTVKNGSVVAFEPMPDNLDALGYVIGRCGAKNIRVETCALGDEDGYAEMILPVIGNARQQGLSHVVRNGADDGETGIPFRVPLRKLDSCEFLFDPTSPVVAIKMDVENHEQYVLAGATRLLTEHRPLIYIELMDNENRARCFEIARGLNYSVFVHEHGSLVPFDESKRNKLNMFLKPNVVD